MLTSPNTDVSMRQGHTSRNIPDQVRSAAARQLAGLAARAGASRVELREMLAMCGWDDTELRTSDALSAAETSARPDRPAAPENGLGEPSDGFTGQLCRRGEHPRTPENVTVRPDGRVGECRLCANTRNRDRKRRDREASKQLAKEAS